MSVSALGRLKNHNVPQLHPNFTMFMLLQGGFIDWSAPKMTRCQPLKEFSELCSSPKKRLRMKKYHNWSYSTVGTVSILLIFLVNIY